METTETKSNENATNLETLHKLIKFIEKRPDLPKLDILASAYTYKKEEFKQFAKTLGSFRKVYSDSYVKLRSKIDDNLDIVISIPRNEVCRKVTPEWECSDDVTSLLKDAVEEEL